MKFRAKQTEIPLTSNQKGPEDIKNPLHRTQGRDRNTALYKTNHSTHSLSKRIHTESDELTNKGDTHLTESAPTFTQHKPRPLKDSLGLKKQSSLHSAIDTGTYNNKKEMTFLYH